MFRNISVQGNKQTNGNGEFPPIKTFASNVLCLMLEILNLCRIVLLVAICPAIVAKCIMSLMFL